MLFNLEKMPIFLSRFFLSRFFLSLVSYRFANFSTVSMGRYRATVIRLDLLTKTLQLVGGGSRTQPGGPLRTIDDSHLEIS